MKNDPLMQSIAETGRLYRSGTLSPVEITEWTLTRIEQLNPGLNAFITVMAEPARQQAEQAERELGSGLDRGPLHGIPVALKDLIDVQGTPTTCGSRIRAQDHPTRTAPLARRLEEGGAVLVGKTNMLEFAYGVPHPDYGQTNNPHDLGRTAGGSSGGSAAAVAAGLCFAAVGTDTGGSIRIPAAYCGVAGLKPTYGLVDLTGVFPLAWSLDHAGPLARSSEDARLLLEALTGTAICWSGPIDTLKVGVLRLHAEGPEMQLEVAEVFASTCHALQTAGIKLRDVQVPDLEWADEALMNILLPEASAAHSGWLQERPSDYAPLTRIQLELGCVLPAVAYVRAQQYRRRLVQRFLAVFGDVDVLISPTVAWVAPAEDPVIAGDEGAAEARRSGPHNLTGFPALSVRAGVGAAGLPVGVQVITPPGQDALALALGSAIERLTAGGSNDSTSADW
ncbi:amidase [Deinococcus sp. SM5_A1]|uniref:amidase n=1 Tax=Deinococcus sp. SM5_A1 TaxID=3379094 RepID=UPI00385AAE92